MKRSKNKKPAAEAPDYLTGYSPMQQRIIVGTEERKQVIAAAGSGKTRTVVGYVEHRLRSDDTLSHKILLLSFSRKAAGELRDRIQQRWRSSVEISTFHSFCFRHLQEIHPGFRRQRIAIMEEREKIEFLQMILNKEAAIIGGIPYAILLQHPDYFQETFPALYRKVQRMLKRHKALRGLFEYDDLIQILLTDLKENQVYLLPLRKKYRLIIVDEFQDTDPQQLEFLKQMNPRELLVVGDDWQSIYSFRGATVKPFLNFRRIFRGAAIYYLSENYRSLHPIVELGNSVIRHSSKQIKKSVKAVRPSPGEGVVYSLSMQNGDDVELAAILKAFDGDYRILARSNYRVARWLQAGIHEDKAMTIHKAKGLEYFGVILDLAGGWSGGGNEQPDDEEIRIAYVGLTRARDCLILLHRPEKGEDTMEEYLWKEIFGRSGQAIQKEDLIRVLKGRKNEGEG